MFGYIYINQKSLSDENKKQYQAYYCGLCHVLRRNCGVRGQMLLNYDMTFLIILLTGLYELPNEELKFVCPLHPGRKKTAYVNEASRYASDMNVLLSYYNLVDDWKDDRSYPKHVISLMLKRDYSRISRKYPRQAKALDTYITKLDLFETRKEDNIDAISGLTGEMLGEIFAWRNDIWAEELHCLGFYLGKFIYLMDAYEDLEKDKKKNEYNPFQRLAEDNPKDFETISKLILTSMMSECAKSFERLPILQHADIIRNILYSGVWSKYEYLQEKKKKRRNPK
ncbi:MAG: DUF5685 family protein [Clostridiales bacterium]|nr:DUF5685 family protein [Clostridiales bacterium]MCD8132865.1 DUF5685 family protein [Clostridiales bacterium]